MQDILKRIIPFCICLVCIFLFGIRASYAQGSSFFIEARGASYHYSVNYAFAIHEGYSAQTNLRIGVGYWNNTVGVPLGISYVGGKRNSYAEFSFTLSPYVIGDNFWDGSNRDLQIDIVLGASYRYQPRSGDFYVSGGIFPYAHFNPTPDQISANKILFKIRPGLSLGWML